MANQQRRRQHTRTLQKCLQVGMYATRAGLISKTNIRQSHAHGDGANQNTKKGLIKTMHRHTSMQDGNQALKEGIRRSSWDFNGVGRRMK